METWRKTVLYGVIFTLFRMALTEELNRSEEVGLENACVNGSRDPQLLANEDYPVESCNVRDFPLINTTDLISEEEFVVFNNGRQIYEKLSFVLLGIVSPVFHVIGIAGNILILIVLCKGILKSPSTPYFIGLAVADLLYLTVSALGMFGAYQTITAKPGWKNFYAFFVCYIYPALTSAFTTGVWVTVTFTVERFIAICHPLTAQRHCTRFRGKVVVISEYVFGFVVNFSRWFRRSLVVTTDPVTNETICKAQFTRLGSSATYTAFSFWSGFVANGILPFIIVAVLNYFIVRQLAKSKVLRATSVSGVAGQGADKNHRDINITRTLLAVVVAFFVCNIGAAVVSGAVAILGTKIYRVWEFRCLIVVSNVTAGSNSAFNCVLYPLCSRSIRRAVLNILLPCRRPDVTTTTTTTTQ